MRYDGRNVLYSQLAGMLGCAGVRLCEKRSSNRLNISVEDDIPKGVFSMVRYLTGDFDHRTMFKLGMLSLVRYLTDCSCLLVGPLNILLALLSILDVLSYYTRQAWLRARRSHKTTSLTF